MIYSAVLEFKMACVLKFQGPNDWVESLLKTSKKNIFEAQDGDMIAVFILDILSGLMLFSATGALYRS
jgi:hypothetical protein